MGETSGLIKYVVERSSRRVLGCHVVGPNAADLVYDAVLVMRHNGTLDEIGIAVEFSQRCKKEWKEQRKGFSRS